MIRIQQYMHPGPVGRLLLMLIACLTFSFSSKAQSSPTDKLEELSVMLHVQRVGSMEVDAFVQGQNVFLSVKEVFDFLKVKNKLSADASTITGSFLDPGTAFTISKDRNVLVFQGKTTRLPEGHLIKTDVGLYLQCNYFATFGLDCSFDYRGLLVNLHAKIELPAIREMQQEIIRRNLSRLKGERKADVQIGQRFPLFRLGAADWQVIYNKSSTSSNDLRLNLALGAMVAGGELNVNSTFVAGKPFDKRMHTYRWRQVNNERSWLRQVIAGNVFTDATSTLLAPMTGIQLNNTPTTYRRSFGTYILSNKTEPGWLVELYVNNILVNYTRADASGFFTFEVPMVYGSSTVKLRFYGPWGEEQTREENVVIPANFMPAGQFEYNLTGGLLNDTSRHRFARGGAKFGLNRSITIGVGAEYFSAVTATPLMPFANASMRLFSNIILHGEYTHGVRSRGILSYRHQSNIQLDINYIKYVKGQTAVKFMEEKRAVLTMPIRTRKFTGFSRLTFTQFQDLKKEPGTSAELLLSTFFSGISSNFTTYAVLTEPKQPLIWSNLSMTFRLPGNLRVTQQTHYHYRQQSINMMRLEAEKPISKNGYANLVFERNMLSKNTTIGVGLRFNLAYAQTSAFVIKSSRSAMFTQSARGSVLYDDNTRKLTLSNQNNVTRGSLTLRPFLDLNGNGVKDASEPKVCGLKVRVSGGRVTHCSSDTTIQISGLEPYANFLLDIDKNSFDNISWQVKQPLVAVVIEPNHYKSVDIPVSVVGEVDGYVYLSACGERTGLGRMLVKVLKNGKQIAKVMTLPDGYFNYMGLTPGKYTVEIDATQLENLQLEATPAKIPFTIREGKEGDFIEGLNFVLQTKANK